MNSAEKPGWEKVTVNRKDQTMTTETLGLNSDGSTAVLDNQKFWVENEHVRNQADVYAAVAKSFRLEQYKRGVQNVLKAIKFTQYESEE